VSKRIHSSDLQNLTSGAESSDRARSHLNTHDTLDATVQRLFIATEPETYIRPHRHSDAHKWEFFVLIEGSMDLLIFDDDGTLVERCRMSRADTRAVEVPPGQWHSYVCREAGTVALEIKQDAYIPTPEIDLAPWAPEENTAASQQFLSWMKDTPVGSAPV